MTRMKRTEQPLVVPIAGDVADQIDAVAGIGCGLAQAKKGLGRSVDEVFNGLERTYSGAGCAVSSPANSTIE